MSTLRILHVIQGFDWSENTGPNLHVKVLSEALKKNGFDVRILSSHRASMQVASHGPHEVPVMEHCAAVSFGHYSVSGGMFWEAMKVKPDIIHVHGYRNFASDAGAIAARILGIPLVLTAHGSVMGFAFQKGGRGRPLDILVYDAVTRKYALKVADAVIATSDIERSQISSVGISEDKVRVIPLGIHVPYKVVRNNPDLDSPQILAVGRVTPIRNYELLLHSFKIVLQSCPSARLIIAGGFVPGRYDSTERKYWPELARVIADLALEKESVRFLGPVSRVELNRLYASCELFVCTSRYENFGLPILEAASFGLPIVCSRVGVVQDLREDDLSPVIVDSASPYDFASAMLRFFDSYGHWAHASKILREKSFHFSAEANFEQHKGLYESLVNRK